VIDKYKQTFYNYSYKLKNIKDPSNHTNGVGAPLNKIGLNTYTQIRYRMVKNLNEQKRSFTLLHIFRG